MAAADGKARLTAQHILRERATSKNAADDMITILSSFDGRFIDLFPSAFLSSGASGVDRATSGEEAPTIGGDPSSPLKENGQSPRATVHEVNDQRESSRAISAKEGDDISEDDSVIRLQMAEKLVDNLKKQCESQEAEMQKLRKQAHDATALAEEKSAKLKAAEEVIKTLTSQLKEMAERLPQGNYEKAESKPTPPLNNTTGTHQLRNSTSNQDNSLNETSKEGCGKGREDNASDDAKKVSEMGRNGDNGSRAQSLLASSNQEEKEWIEQYEPGVYLTLVAFHDGTRELKRVRFSRRRFGEHQAESWWAENREKVYEKYDVRGGSD